MRVVACVWWIVLLVFSVFIGVLRSDWFVNFRKQLNFLSFGFGLNFNLFGALKVVVEPDLRGRIEEALIAR